VKLSLTLSALVVLLEAIASTPSFAIDLPEQFQSSNAAVILGLDKSPELRKPNAVLTEEIVNQAWKELLKKYHTDKYASGKYSAAEIAAVLDAAKKINTARDALLKQLETDRNFNPVRNDFGSSGGDDVPNQRTYSWEDVYAERAPRAPDHGVHPPDQPAGERSSETAPVRSSPRKTSMLGTMFGFLEKHPGFEQAFISLDAVTIGKGVDYSVLMIVDPNLFPMIEFRYLSKQPGQSGVQLVKTVWGTYTPGRHQGQDRVDGIALPNGSYYFNPFYSQTQLSATPIEATSGKKLMIQTGKSGLLLLEMGPDGYSRSRALDTKNYQEDPTSILPNTKPLKSTEPKQVPAWKNIRLPQGETPLPPSSHEASDAPKTFKYFVVSKGQSKIDLELVDRAIQIVGAAAPKNVVLEAGNASSFDFVIQVGDSSQFAEEMAQHRAAGVILNESADAYSMRIADEKNRQLTVVRLLLDRMGIQKGQSVSHDDAFARIIAAVGHEVYGNVRTFSQKQAKVVTGQVDPIEQALDEVRAFGAGIETLERAIDQLKSSANPPKKGILHLQEALNREKITFQKWVSEAQRMGSATCLDGILRELGKAPR
jgi:hypothetical protein